MKQKINYQDNFYLLAQMINTLHAGLALPVDSELFLDKIVEDIFFLDSSFERLYSSLKEHIHLINREKYLKGMLAVKSLYIAFIDDIIRDKLAFSKNLKPFYPQLTDSYREQKCNIEEIESMLNHNRAQKDEKDTITAEELRFLLGTEETEARQQDIL